MTETTRPHPAAHTTSPPELRPPARLAPAAERLGALDALRGAAIALVVGTHALGYVELADPALRGWLRFAIQAPCVIAFFFADGFLLARKGAWSAARSAKRLLWPWLLFSALYGGLRALYEIRLPPEEWLLRGHGPLEWLASAWRSEWSAQLYFLPSLFLIRSASPLLLACTRAGPAACWLAWLLCAIASPLWLMPLWQHWFPGPGQEPVLHALWGLPFALLGSAAAGSAAHVPRGPLPPLAVAAAALLAHGAAPHWPALAQHLYLAALFLSCWCLDPAPAWSALGRRSMAIFLLHLPLAMLPCALLAHRAAPDAPLTQLALIWSGSFALALLGALALERIPGGRLLLGEPAKRPTTPR